MQVMDYDVLNLAGIRKKVLLKQREMSSCELVVHHGPQTDKGLFAAALTETLQWLKPDRVTDQVWGPKERNEALFQTGQRIFSRSRPRDEAFVDRILGLYNQEMPFEDFLFVEHYRLLPLFLRRHFKEAALTPLMTYEIEKILMESREFLPPRLAKGELAKNPSLFLVDHREPPIPFLPSQDIYLVAVEPGSMEVQAHVIGPDEARLLDFFEEDVRMTESLLLAAVKTEKSGLEKSEKYWQDRIRDLISKGLILTGGGQA